MPNIPVAAVPGHTGVQSKEELRRNILDVTMDNVIRNLVGAPAEATEEVEPAARDIVVRGTFDEVNQYFYEHELADGLPIVPPTIERVERMLAYCDRAWDTPIAKMAPRYGEATPLKLAANAVMAGCRPEYFPLLMLAVEAMCEEPFNLYGIQATTHLCAPLVIVNGPVAQELGVN